MKHLCAMLLAAGLLLCAACQKEPQPAEPPQTSAPQEAPALPETPDTPETPEEPVTPGPADAPESPGAPGGLEQEPAAPQEAFVLPENAAALPTPGEVLEGFSTLGCLTPLTDRVMALMGYGPEGAALLLYDYVDGAVLSQQEMPSHDGTQLLSVLEREPWRLYYYDGQRQWQVALDPQWQAAVEAYDPATELSALGDQMIAQEDNSIAVGRTVPPALQGDANTRYQAVRVIDDHRLLYQRVGGKTGTADFGVYDHDTGEGRLVTTLGQSVIGVWGESLLIGRPAGEERWYGLALMQLSDMDYTPLTLGHESAEEAVRVVQMDDAGTRLLVQADSGTGETAQLFSLPEGTLLVQWEAAEPDAWELYLTGDCLLFCRQSEDGSQRLLWQLKI